MELLREQRIEQIEREFAGGIPARAILDVFRPTGVALSEATFRKYVQVGLLPRSRRVGRKGKHQGSRGLYPVQSVRRLNAIKRMMAEGMTLEDIKRSFLVFRNQLDEVERELEGLLARLAGEVASREHEIQRRKTLETRIRRAREKSHLLIREVAGLGSQIATHSIRQ
ncbi:MAG: MerR family transcriptional regulator [Myxococcaceae bacterium]